MATKNGNQKWHQQLYTQMVSKNCFKNGFQELRHKKASKNYVQTWGAKIAAENSV